MAFWARELFTRQVATTDVPYRPGIAGGLPPSMLVFNRKNWTLPGVREKFPELEQSYKASPRAQKRSFKDWYLDETTTYPYALGDASLFVNRVTGRSDLGALSGPDDRLDDMFTAEQIMALAQRDGLKLTGDQIVWNINARPVALLMMDSNLAEKKNYLFLRLDRIDPLLPLVAWTRKNARQLPTLVTDEEGRSIIDPRNDMPPHRPGVAYEFICFANIPNTASLSFNVLGQYLQKGRKAILMRHEEAYLAYLATNRHDRYMIPQYD